MRFPDRSVIGSVTIEGAGEFRVVLERTDDDLSTADGAPVTRKWLAEALYHGVVACLCRHGKVGNRENTNPDCPRHGWEVREHRGERPRTDW